VGADRKGPLAAFIVIAIIAAILLVTSVRSQAATGWLRDALPSTPTVVNAVGDGVDQIVEGGSVLVQGSTDQPLPPETPETSSPAPDSGDPTPGDDVHHRVGHRVRDDGTDRHHDSGPKGHRRHPALSGAAPDDHGRHLGWTHGPGHGNDHGHPGHGRHLGWIHAHRG
jgi:hypothetical protein